MSWLAATSHAGLIVLFLSARAAPCAAQSETPHEESEMKAAMLFNFACFVEWPGQAVSPLTVGLAADHGFLTVFERLFAGKVVNGRPVVVKRIGRPADAAACDMVYLADARPVAAHAGGHRRPQRSDGLRHARFCRSGRHHRHF